MKPADLAKYIDHTLLKPSATRADIAKLCDEAITHKFASVCVNTCHVAQCAMLLKGKGVAVCAVVGFPLGAMETEAKAFETSRAVELGATEIDMVLPVGLLIAGEDDDVRADIAAVVDAAGGKVVKVILETSMLNDEQKERGCRLSVEAGAHFVKTSTGFGGGGATVDDIKLFRRVVGPNVGVKASGGIRDAATAIAMVEAGATRLGVSAGVAIVTTGAAAGAGY